MTTILIKPHCAIWLFFDRMRSCLAFMIPEYAGLRVSEIFLGGACREQFRLARCLEQLLVLVLRQGCKRSNIRSPNGTAECEQVCV